jgi:hypothetical protein
MATPQLNEVLIGIGAVRDEIERLLKARDDGESINAGNIMRSVFSLSGPLGTALQGADEIKGELQTLTEDDARRLGGDIAVFLLDVYPDKKANTKLK